MANLWKWYIKIKIKLREFKLNPVSISLLTVHSSLLISAWVNQKKKNSVQLLE